MSLKRLLQRCLFAGCLTMALLASSLTAQASAQDDEPAERRVTNRDTESGGQGEAGVRLEDVSALTSISSGGGGPGRGGGSGCRWTVVNSPELWTGDHISNVESAANAYILRGGETQGAAGVPEYTTAWLYGESQALVAGGASVASLRYVQPYGSAACNQAAGAWITTGEIENLAILAFDEVKTRWPGQEITLGWPEPTEDTWTALATEMPWDSVSATASNGGLEVTVTATPMVSEWAIGEVNTRIGGNGQVVCSGPGDLPRVQDDASCRVWFAGPSTGLADRHGQSDAVTLGLTVQWNVGYTSNFAGFANPNWLVWPTESFLDGVIVNTTQSVPSLEVASG